MSLLILVTGNDFVAGHFAMFGANLLVLDPPVAVPVQQGKVDVAPLPANGIEGLDGKCDQAEGHVAAPAGPGSGTALPRSGWFLRLGFLPCHALGKGARCMPALLARQTAHY